MAKQFKLKNIKEIVTGYGYCFASDKITVDGEKVGYMYRDIPENENDSGWKFFSGTETQDYVDDPNNIMIYNINTIANYDSSIITYLNHQYGSELERIDDSTEFKSIR